MLVLPTFPTSSMITGTMPAAPEVSPNLWRWLKKSDSPTLSTGKDFKPVLPKFLIEDILCTHAVCVCNKWAGKVFASLIKLSILSNTKLGNQLCSKTLLCEQQFIVVSAYHSQSYTSCLRFKIYHRKTNCFCTNTLPRTNVYGIYLCHVFLGVCMGGL